MFRSLHNIPIQIWRHAVMSGLHFHHVCYLSVLYFLLLMYILDENLLSTALPALSCFLSHHKTCLRWALPCITFCSGRICCMSLNICKDDIHDMWPVHMVLLELMLIWRTLTCKFERASATDIVRRFNNPWRGLCF